MIAWDLGKRCLVVPNVSGGCFRVIAHAKRPISSRMELGRHCFFFVSRFINCPLPVAGMGYNALYKMMASRTVIAT